MTTRLADIDKTYRKVGATMINAAMVGLGRWGQTVLGSIQGKSTRLRIVHGVTKEPELARELAPPSTASGCPPILRTQSPTRRCRPFCWRRRIRCTSSRCAWWRPRGKPVWCEKPLALTRAEAERAVAAVRAAGVPLGSGNNKRCFASMRELKRVVESGELGNDPAYRGRISPTSTRPASSGGWRDDPKRVARRRHDRRGPARARCVRSISVGRSASVDARSFTNEAAARSARRARRAGASSPPARPACMATVRAAPMYLARPRVRHQRHGRSARRGHADRRQDRRARRQTHTTSTSTRCACCSKPSPTRRGQGAVPGVDRSRCST